MFKYAIAFALMTTAANAQGINVPIDCKSPPKPLNIIVDQIEGEPFYEQHFVGIYKGDTEEEKADEIGPTFHIYVNMDTGSWTMIIAFGNPQDPLGCFVAGGDGPMFAYMGDAYDLIPGTDM